MDNKSSSGKQTQSKRFYQRRSVKIIGFLVVLAAAVQIALPIGIRIFLEKWLEDNGADSATIEKVRLIPFVGVAGLEGVTIEKDGETVFADTNISLDIRLRDLLGRTALVEQVTLEDVIVDIEKGEDGSFRIASYTLSPAGDKKAGEVTVEDPKEKTGNPWIIYARNIDIRNVEVRYGQPGFDVELVIEEARIQKLNTDPDSDEGSLMLRGKVNGSPVVLDFTRLSFLPFLDLDGQVQVSDFHLQEFAPLVEKALKSFEGSAGLDGRVVFRMEDSRNMNVSYDGSIGLADGNIDGPRWATGGSVNWGGRASFTMNSGEMAVVTEGDLQALDAAFDMPQPLIDIDNSDILISGRTEVKIAGEVTVDTTASLTLAPTTYLANGFQTGAGDTSWAGRILVNTGTEKNGLGVQADGKLSIAEPVFDMDMEKGQMEIGNGLLTWEGKVEYLKGVGGEEDQVRTDGRLEGTDTFYRLPDLVNFAQQNLLFSGETVVKISKPLTVKYSGDFSLEGTEVDIGDMSIDDGAIHWHGEAGYQLAENSQSISLNGLLKSSDASFEMAGPQLQLVQKELEVKPEFQFKFGDKPSFDGTIGLGGAGLAVDFESQPLLTLEEIAAKGLRGDGSGGIQGESLQLGRFVLHASDKVPVRAEISDVSFSGIRSSDLMSLEVERITVESPTVEDAEGMKRLAGLDAIAAEHVAVDKNLVAEIGKIVLDNGSFLSEAGKGAVATMKQLLVETISYTPDGGLVCDAVTLDSVYANILMEKKEEGQVEPEEKEEAGAQTEEQAKPSAIPVKVNRIDVVGESGMKFADPNLARTFMTELNIDSLKIRDIDLTKPEKPFTYNMKGAIEKYTPLNVSGQCAPLAADLFIDQQVSIHNLSMLRISPYSVEAIGIFFPSGMMDFTSSLKIGEGMIDMENNLLLSDISVEEVHGELAKELNNQLPVPFNLAMTMLKDGEGKIDLDVPIKGKLSDMSIGISDIIWTPLSNAITIAVTPYLAYTALGPAGALTYFGTKLGKKMFETKLPVLEFEPGEKGLTEKHLQKLDQAGKKILKELEKGDADTKPFLICAKVSVAELTTVSSDAEENQEVFRNEAIRRELFKLGEARSLAVKDYLTATHGIPADRLEVCNPGLNFDAAAKPVIEFMK